MSSLPERLCAARSLLKLKQSEFAEQIGVSERAYQGYEAGRSVPGGNAIEGIARAGINVNWLLTGEGEIHLSDSLKDKPYEAVVDAAGHAVNEPPKQAPWGFVLVPRYDVAASMGNGTVIHSEQIVDHLAFREEWVRTELGTNPKHLVLVSAIGDSMEPTLRAGDLLLIDRNSEGVKQDAVYAFATNGELRVKRMQLKIDGSVVVKSDNPQYEAELLTSEQASALRIVGRVVWSGRRM